MKREILFRAKRLDNKEWVFGFFVFNLLHDPTDYRILYLVKDRLISVSVDIKTVGQFTGQLDTKGAKIFDGDICTDEEGTVWACIWDAEIACFGFDAGNYTHNFTNNEKWTIAGNIFNNPELLIFKDEEE